MPVPQTGPTADRIDQGLEQAFAAVTGMQLRGRPYEVRQAMNASHRLVVWADKIQAQRFDSNALAHAPSLSTILTPKELEDLHSALNANILLVPTPFELQSATKNTAGRAGYRAYELPTGRLLRQNSFAVTVPEGGEPGEKRATVELVLQIETDFEKHLL